MKKEAGGMRPDMLLCQMSFSGYEPPRKLSAIIKDWLSFIPVVCYLQSVLFICQIGKLAAIFREEIIKKALRGEKR